MYENVNARCMMTIHNTSMTNYGLHYSARHVVLLDCKRKLPMDI